MPRYLRIKYEDIAASTEHAVQVIYSWSGLGSVPTSVLSWIDINTKLSACDNGQKRTMRHLKASSMKKGMSNGKKSSYGFRDGNIEGNNTQYGSTMDGNWASRLPQDGNIFCGKNKKLSGKNPFGTKRQSTYMVDLWRTQMPEEEATAVWEICEDVGVTSELGYLL